MHFKIQNWRKSNPAELERVDGILCSLAEGHHYEMEIDGNVYYATLAMLWTGGHTAAQFILDDGSDCFELMAHHYGLKSAKDLGEVGNNSDVVKNATKTLLASCRKFVYPFDCVDSRVDCSLHYCGNAIFKKAWDMLVENGLLIQVEVGNHGPKYRIKEG